MIHKLTEAPPRAEFFERTDFEVVRRQLRPDLQCAITIAGSYGWRMQSEVLTLTLSQVDLSAGTLRINPGGSKTGEGRIVYLSHEVRMMLEEQLERVRTLSRKQGAGHSLSVSTLAGWSPSRAAYQRLPKELGQRVQGGGIGWQIAP